MKRGTIYWLALLFLSALYAFGTRLVSIEALAIPLFVQSALSYHYAATRGRGFAKGSGVFVLLGLITPIILIIMILASSGQAFTPLDAAAIVALIALEFRFARGPDSLAYLELLAMGSIMLLPHERIVADPLIPVFVFLLLSLAIVARASRGAAPEGGRKDAPETLGSFLGLDRAFRSAGPPALLAVSASVILSFALHASPGMAVPVSICFLSFGRLISAQD